jgi:signal recognition particle subunit SRP54
MMAEQLAQMQRMGGMEGLMGMLPGVQKAKKQIAESGITDKVFARQRAIISSMTKDERRKPDILQASRKRRIARGAGVDVSEINRLLKQHRQMADAFKMMSRGGGKGFAQMAGMLGLGGGGPGAGAADMARLKAMGGGKLPSAEEIQKALPGLGGGDGGGLKLPGLGAPPGFNPFKK